MRRKGHRQTACPNNGLRGLLANEREMTGEQIYDTEEEELDDTEEEQVAGDRGTLLMLQKIAWLPRQQKLGNGRHYLTPHAR